jgi:diacylglycerol kinase (ATP)
MNKTIASFIYAFRGIADFFRTERNARWHLAAALLAAVAGFWLRIDRYEWMAVVVCIGVVMALEAMNTALEHLTNLVSPGYQPLAGRAKDAAAGAVLLAAIGAAVIGGIIFLPKIIAVLLRFFG